MWLLQNLVSGWVQAVLAVAFGAVAAYLKSQGSTLMDPLLYGVGASAILLVAFAAIRVSIHHRIEERVTLKNVESLTRQWLDIFGATVKRMTIPGTHFAFEVGTPFGGINMILTRPEIKDRYLMLEAAICPLPEQKSALTRAASADAQRVVSKIRIALSSANISGFSGASLPLERISVSLGTQIVPTLTEQDLTQAITRLEGVIAIVLETLNQGILELSEQNPEGDLGRVQ